MEFGALVLRGGWCLRPALGESNKVTVTIAKKGTSHLPRLFSLQPRVEGTRTLGKVYDLLVTIIKILVIPGAFPAAEHRVECGRIQSGDGFQTLHQRAQLLHLSGLLFDRLEEHGISSLQLLKSRCHVPRSLHGSIGTGGVSDPTSHG